MVHKVTAVQLIYFFMYSKTAFACASDMLFEANSEATISDTFANA